MANGLLSGKTAVITGCLQGIGNATMHTFAREGANVFACCERTDDAFEKAAQALSDETGVDIIPVYFDLSDAAAIKDAATTIHKTKRPINALINIAGVNIDALFQMVTLEQLQATFMINFYSHILFTQYITKLMMRQQAGGSIVFTSSIAALDGNEGQLAYAASKAALLGAVKTMSLELAPKGIRVNAVAPGVIDTAMTRALSDDALAKFMDKSDLKHLGTPQEVANTFAFLASDYSSYITGQTLRVDGGMG